MHSPPLECSANLGLPNINSVISAPAQARRLTLEPHLPSLVSAMTHDQHIDACRYNHEMDELVEDAEKSRFNE